jgi:RNA polymerase sigma factor (sigma-70 family)
MGIVERVGPVEELGDGELMACFYALSEAAFGVLTERWWNRLFGFFRRLGFCNEDAEDLTQETLVKLYQTRETLGFDVRQPLEPFLLTVARRLAIREWRRRRPERQTVPLMEAEDVVSEEPALRRELVDDLFLCIWKLPQPQQIYILLCAKHGLGDRSHTEIGTILGKWPAQLTQISQRARANLRECMAAKGYRAVSGAKVPSRNHNGTGLEA